MEIPGGWGGFKLDDHPWGRYGYFLESHNINKDGAHFGVGVRLWQSYGKIEDCKQSNKLFKKSVIHLFFMQKLKGEIDLLNTK